MNKSFDVSLHGMSRVEIVEQVAHLCRYCPGVIYLDGQQGGSPVNFLRDLAALLRDELDLALLSGNEPDIDSICRELLVQWFVYRPVDSSETDIQAIHHFLDVATQSGGQALIIVERTLYLRDEALDFLLALMARHARLTVLFSGLDDSRKLLNGAARFEVPINSIELPDDLPLSATVGHPQQDVGAVTSTSALQVVGQVGEVRDMFTGLQAGDVSLRASRDVDEDWLFDDDLGDEPRAVRDDLSGSQGVRVSAGKVDNKLLDDDRGFELGHSSVMLGALTGIRERFVAKKQRNGLVLLLAVAVVLLMAWLMVRQGRQQPPVETVANVNAPQGATPALATQMSSQQLGGGGQDISPPPVVGAPPPVLPTKDASVDEAPLAPSLAGSVTVVAPAEKQEQVKPARIVPAVAPPSREKSSRKLSGLGANPDYFTIQVAAAHGKGTIEAMAGRLPSTHPHLIHQAVRDGKAWYVLVYGSFPTRKAADKAKAALVSELKTDSSPWVRKQGEIFGSRRIP
jgi:hypothetical protein